MAKLAQGAAVAAYQRLMTVSEKIRRTGLDAEDVVNVFLAVTLNLVTATSWRDNVVGFLRDAAEQYGEEVENLLQELDRQAEQANGSEAAR